MDKIDNIQTLLGQETEYPDAYCPQILTPIPRRLARQSLQQPSFSFQGWDDWTAYEFSWINPTGIPEVAILQLRVPASSENLVESKSLKMYLNGFANESIESSSYLLKVLQRDLQSCIGESVAVDIELHTLDRFQLPKAELEGFIRLENNLGMQWQRRESVQPAACFGASRSTNNFAVCTDLFRSLCPVTGQPDWATLFLSGRGSEIQRSELLAYLLQFRNHKGFHEQCVEKIFQDLWQTGKLEALCVNARYTRRGGIEINPIRFSDPGFAIPDIRTIRQ